MNRSRKRALTGFGLMLAGVIAMPVGAALAFNSTMLDSGSSQVIARGGGGRGGGGGGGRGGGGGGGARAGGGGARVGAGGGGRKGGGHSGFSNAGGGLNRGSTKPTGGWSSKAKVGGGSANPSLSRPASASRPAVGTRTATGARSSSALPGGDRTPRELNRTSGDRLTNRDGSRDLNRDGSRNVNRDINRNVNRDINRDINRNWNRDVDLNNVNLYPGWARPGWGVARPWNYGWYGGWATPAWGWWGARAAAWGVTTLATAAIINDAVDDAVDDHNSYIVVPNTNYQLLYGTVTPAGSDSVSFVVQVDGNDYQLNANCKQGTINGQDPSNADEAELLNAACQVAYGSV